MQWGFQCERLLLNRQYPVVKADGFCVVHWLHRGHGEFLQQGLTPEFLDVLEEGFKEFFEKEVPGNPLKAEYLIPIFIGELLEQGKMSVKVLKTNDTWYGMTYHEDVAAVKDSFKKMLETGVYKADLFADL